MLTDVRATADRTLRWGILGAGVIAGEMAVDIAASLHSELVALAARDGVRARAVATQLGIPRAYGSYDELVRDPDVDIVYVATTHPHHHQQSLLALNAGKHVLVEKPFALNGHQAREIIGTATNAGLFCMEAMWMRMHPLIRRAHAIASTGDLGELTSVRAHLSRAVPYDPRHRLFNPATGGGALLDLGIYPAHLAWLFLGQPDSIKATASLAPTGVDHAVEMHWSYRDGRQAHITASTRLTDRDGAVINGTRGRIIIPPPMQVPSEISVTIGGVTTTTRAQLLGNGYGPQIAEVERCIRGGETASPLAPLDDTAAVLDALDNARHQVGLRYPDEAVPVTPSRHGEGTRRARSSG